MNAKALAQNQIQTAAASTRGLAIDGQTSLRICLLGYRSHPHVGGQGIYIHYLSKALLAAGHEVDVISGPPYPDLAEGVRLIKMPSLDLFAVDDPLRALRWSHLGSYTDTFEWCSKLTGGFAEPYTFGRRAAKYLRQHGHHYDLVHDNQCLAYGLLNIQNRGLPVIATVHHPITRDLQLKLDAEPGWGMRLLIKRWHSFLRMQKRVVQKLQHIVTVSEQSRADIASAFKRPLDRIDLIYNGIDTDVFTPCAATIKEPFSLITTASADQPLKGLRYLLEALALVRGEYPQAKLTVIGKLQAGGETEKLLRKLSLQSHVTFISGISTEALVTQYNRALVAVVPSLYEGFGLPAGEAMACGLPLVATTGGAIPEVVGEAAISVDIANSQALATAIARLFADPQLRSELGAAARQRIVDSFSWGRVAEQLTRYYRQVLTHADR